MDSVKFKHSCYLCLSLLVKSEYFSRNNFVVRNKTEILTNMYLSPEIVSAGQRPFKDNPAQTEVDISNRQLLSIKDLGMFSDLTKLRALFGSTNYLKSIENVFANTPNLMILDLSLNHISNIEGLDKLTFLKYLDLSKNRIEKIKGLSALQNLEKLVSYD